MSYETVIGLEIHAQLRTQTKIFCGCSTEFGATPLFTTEELASVGVDLALYPLSAFRAMSKAALNVYQHLLDDGTQKAVVDTMQTRMELYDFLGYHEYEQKLDQLFEDES